MKHGGSCSPYLFQQCAVFATFSQINDAIQWVFFTVYCFGFQYVCSILIFLVLYYPSPQVLYVDMRKNENKNDQAPQAFFSFTTYNEHCVLRLSKNVSQNIRRLHSQRFKKAREYIR